MKQCKCEHWQQCPTCQPSRFDAQGNRLPPEPTLLQDCRAKLEMREAVIKLLERDAHEAHQRAANAIGTRKVLWNLLGECLPLLEYDAQETHCGESHDQIVDLLRRINDARSVVQAEELLGRPEAAA